MRSHGEPGFRVLPPAHAQCLRELVARKKHCASCLLALFIVLYNVCTVSRFASSCKGVPAPKFCA